MENCLARDVQLKLQKLTEYAHEGKWDNVLEFAGHYKTAAAAAAAAAAAQVSATQPRHQQQGAELAFVTFKVHALMRLRKYDAAAAELAQVVQTWNLPGPEMQQQQQQRQGTGNDVSAGVPFGLLYLRAQLPACQGDSSLTLDLLHDLRCCCEQQLQQLAQQQQALMQKQQKQQQPQAVTPDACFKHPDQQDQGFSAGSTRAAAAAAAATAAASSIWQHRLYGVTCSLVLHYWQAGLVAAALHLLDQQMLLQPADCQLWSLAGKLYLQLNMLKQAHRCFSKVQQLVQQQQQQGNAAEWVQLQKLVHHNWGCYHALNNNMTAALHEFDTAQQLAAAAAASTPRISSGSGGADQTQQTAAPAAAVDGVALANGAVCLLHMGQLTEAISCLEAGLLQHPAEVAQECTLFNLGLMFDLAYRASSAQQARRHIANSLVRSVPDDFDLAAIAPEHSS